MKITKTKNASYCLGGVCRGCKQCVRGEKLVLFISGKCSRNCWYCSLSKKRKNVDSIWANERKISKVNELIEEAEQSRAKGAGITGGDPLLFLNRTIKFASALKRKFGRKFHIHIYLPTQLVNERNIKKLSKYVDEFRLHPSFLVSGNFEEGIEKIKIVSEIVGKSRLGIELPMIPDKKKDILRFVLNVARYISFLNLNEFELSETNFDIVTKKYKLKEGGYIVKDSLKAGLWVLNELKKRGTKIKVHLCTDELKSWHQFKNRLKRYKILPFSRRLDDGAIAYFSIRAKNARELKRLGQKVKRGFVDKKKLQLIIPFEIVKRLKGKEKIFRIEEFPTSDRTEISVWEI